MPTNSSNNVNRQIQVKAQSDTDQKLENFRKMRRADRRLRVEGSEGKNEKKEIVMGEAMGNSDVISSTGSLGIVMALGLTLSLINDFSDLVFWQKISLVSQTLDITSLLLILFMVIFASRAYFFSVFLIIFVFLFEILPVIGVLPMWTIGTAAWYFVNRKKD